MGKSYLKLSAFVGLSLTNYWVVISCCSYSLNGYWILSTKYESLHLAFAILIVLVWSSENVHRCFEITFHMLSLGPLRTSSCDDFRYETTWRITENWRWRIKNSWWKCGISLRQFCITSEILSNGRLRIIVWTPQQTKITQTCHIVSWRTRTRWILIELQSVQRFHQCVAGTQTGQYIVLAYEIKQTRELTAGV